MSTHKMTFLERKGCKIIYNFHISEIIKSSSETGTRILCSAKKWTTCYSFLFMYSFRIKIRLLKMRGRHLLRPLENNTLTVFFFIQEQKKRHIDKSFH